MGVAPVYLGVLFGFEYFDKLLYFGSSFKVFLIYLAAVILSLIGPE